MSRAGTIDGPQLARDRGTVSGTLGIDALPRLAASGCDAATLRYRVRGGVNSAGRPCLAVEASGVALLACQRCLGAVEFPVDLSVELELVASEREILGADDDLDRVLATNEMDVASLVEDEALLVLPMAPMHGRCGPDAGQRDPDRAAPFAVLAGLRKGGGGDG
jgi:uncharacterized protein